MTMKENGELKLLSDELLKAMRTGEKWELQAVCCSCKSMFVDDLPFENLVVLCPKCFPEKAARLHRGLRPHEVERYLGMYDVPVNSEITNSSDWVFDDEGNAFVANREKRKTD
jgi:hypothetical protein